MTGSRRWFSYLNDGGVEFAVQLDESIAETAALGFGAITAGPLGPVAQGRILTATGSIPLAMRRIRCSRVDGNGDTVRRTYYVGTVAAFATLKAAGVVTVDSEAYSITFSKGEEAKGVPATDTGITDGDDDANFAAGP